MERNKGGFFSVVLQGLSQNALHLTDKPESTGRDHHLQTREKQQFKVCVKVPLRYPGFLTCCESCHHSKINYREHKDFFKLCLLPVNTQQKTTSQSMMNPWLCLFSPEEAKTRSGPLG